MKPPPICPLCGEEQGRWLNTRPQDLFPSLAFVMQASAAYDQTPKGVAERRRIRWERWRDLVNTQMKAVADQCRSSGHSAPSTQPRIVQLDLLDHLEAA